LGVAQIVRPNIFVVFEVLMKHRHSSVRYMISQADYFFPQITANKVLENVFLSKKSLDPFNNGNANK